MLKKIFVSTIFLSIFFSGVFVLWGLPAAYSWLALPSCFIWFFVSGKITLFCFDWLGRR